jgi:hypothetical protein
VDNPATTAPMETIGLVSGLVLSTQAMVNVLTDRIEGCVLCNVVKGENIIFE